MMEIALFLDKVVVSWCFTSPCISLTWTSSRTRNCCLRRSESTQSRLLSCSMSSRKGPYLERRHGHSLHQLRRFGRAQGHGGCHGTAEERQGSALPADAYLRHHDVCLAGV